MDEVLAHITHRVLDELQCTSIFMATINSTGEIEISHRYGMAFEDLADFRSQVSIREKRPVTDALKSRKCIWINSLPYWGDEYIDCNIPEWPFPDKTLIACPIERAGTPIAVVGFFSSSRLEPHGELESFLHTIGNLLALYMFKNFEIPRGGRLTQRQRVLDQSTTSYESLTERQEKILERIAEGRTNAFISHLLGYSESTIRQETIRIYAKLGCFGREAAAEIYRLKKEKLGA